ncbi:MAG: HAMP domain-containing sensor histidine kinase [Nitrospirota bacterium]
MKGRIMGGQKRTCAAGAIVLSALAITYLHYVTIPEIHALHNIYRELYYIPVLLGALVFGLKGAVGAYILCAVLYLPYVFLADWTGSPLHEADRLLHFLFTGLFASLAGFLIDRERRQRRELQREHDLATIGRVATTIVHDLKTPLITVHGFARRIRDGKGDVLSAAREILDAAQTMQRIVFDVLDFARPIRFELKEEDARSIVDKACQSCKEKAAVMGITLSAELPGYPVNVEVDRFYLERALVNLITNALEASGKGQAVLVRALHEEASLRITIKDEGTGMDDEALENIFVPFFTRKSKGTGLGMSLAKKIVEGHYGTIRITSREGAGTEAMITLPCKAAPLSLLSIPFTGRSARR